MYLQQAQSTKTFEEAKEISKIDLILDDIKVANKQLSILDKEALKLTTDLADCKFHYNELDIEKESLIKELSKKNALDQQSDSNFPNEGQFFGYLNSIENREVDISAKIDANKQIQSDLSSQLNKLRQENIKLKAQLEPLVDTFEDEEAKYRHSDDVKKDLLISLDQKTIENENLLQQCAELQEELNRRNEELNGVTFQTFKELKNKLKVRKDELATIKKKSELLRSQCEIDEKKQRKELSDKKETLQKGSSVAKWRADRSVLKNKLKSLKAQVFNEQKNIEFSNKRDQELEKKFHKLLDGDNTQTSEHNFGQCSKARKCVLAQMNESDSRVRKVSSLADLEYEKEYGEQLLKEKEKIKKSKQIFDQYRDSVLTGLNIELDGCSQNGYIKLLRDEFYQLQNELSKLV